MELFSLVLQCPLFQSFLVTVHACLDSVAVVFAVPNVCVAR